MERIYHRYENWECYKSGFFNNVSGNEKTIMENKMIAIFSSSELTEYYMREVILKWVYSCEHNLSNLSLNRVAWLGQSACCVYAKIPYKITMNHWRYLDKERQKTSCDIAEKIIKEYEQSFNKRQLCLKFI
jgi:hypothetical protein